MLIPFLSCMWSFSSRFLSFLLVLMLVSVFRFSVCFSLFRFSSPWLFAPVFCLPRGLYVVSSLSPSLLMSTVTSGSYFPAVHVWIVVGTLHLKVIKFVLTTAKHNMDIILSLCGKTKKTKLNVQIRISLLCWREMKSSYIFLKVFLRMNTYLKGYA